MASRDIARQFCSAFYFHCFSRIDTFSPSLNVSAKFSDVETFNEFLKGNSYDFFKVFFNNDFFNRMRCCSSWLLDRQVSMGFDLLFYLMPSFLHTNINKCRHPLDARTEENDRFLFCPPKIRKTFYSKKIKGL